MEGISNQDSPNSAAASTSTREPRTQNFLTGIRYGSDLTNPDYSRLLNPPEEPDGQFLTLGVGAKQIPVPFQDRLVLFPSPPLVHNQPGLQGFAEYAPFTSPLNFHGTAITTAYPGIPTYNPQPGLSLLPLPSSTTSFPRFPGTLAMSRQNQSVNIGQPQEGHQVQPSSDTSFISRGQLPGAPPSFRPSLSSHVSSPVRDWSSQDHPPVNIDINCTRTQPLPSFLVPPPVQSEASQATQGWVDLSWPHSWQAPASPNLAHTATAVRPSTQSIQPWFPTRSQSPRHVPSQARKYAPAAQKPGTATAFEQRIDLKNTSKQQRAKVASSLFAQQRVSWQSALPPAQQRASSQSPLPLAPSSTIRIQRKEESHKLVGHNCYFCKRDLSYPPEGPIVVNPANLPEDAVLACGHPFHNFCLHRITPPEMASDPPCIPCAVMEA